MSAPYCLSYVDAWDRDAAYHPDDVIDAYLDESLVEGLCNKLKARSSRFDDIVAFIKMHEKTHRDFVLGNISRSDRDRIVDEASEAYRRKYHKWAHSEPEYNEFYKIVNSGNW